MSRTGEFFRGLAGSLLKSLTKSGTTTKPRVTRSAASKRSTGPSGRASSALDQQQGAGGHQRRTAGEQRSTAGQQSDGGGEIGRSGATATIEVVPAKVGKVKMTYAPSIDGDPDPGEIVWTWVPFEENDGRGKDRPVLIVASLTNGSVLAVQLTSKAHDGNREFLSLGTGSWDAENRPSWVNLDRVFQVHPQGMRREAASLDKARFDRVRGALTSRYSWS